MNHNLNSAVKFASDFLELIKDEYKKDIVVCAPFPYLAPLAKVFADTNVLLGTQNLCHKEEGAFTGEVSASMLKDFCNYVIIGHSERRQLFGETDKLVNEKINAALKYELTPIVCCGETLGARNANKTNEFIASQLTNSLAGLNSKQLPKIELAYEPIWAIGTGKTATPEVAQETHALIRSWIKEKYNNKTADKMRIIYGGSVKPENCKPLMQQADIDGALVGGASLKAESFAKIVKFEKQ